MGEKRNVPKLRFPGFGQDWQEKSLGQLLEFKNGFNASKESYGSGEKFINVLDIIQNDFITHDKIIGSVQLSLSEFEKYKVEYGDILFQRSSETREEVGQANVYLDKQRPSTFGGFVIRGKKVGEYEPFFLNSLLKTPSARNEITSKSGGSTRYNVGQETLSRVSVLLPSLPEQEKIAGFLTAVDRRIELLQAKRAKLEAYKKGVMQGIFSQKIRFRADDGSAFPDWEEKKLGEVYEFRTTNSFSRDKMNEESGEFRNIHYGDIHIKLPSLVDLEKVALPFVNEDVEIRKTFADNLVEAGDLIIADASEDYNDIGKTIEVVNTEGQRVLAGLHTLHAKPSSGSMALGFGGYLMKSQAVRNQVKKIAQGTKVLSISVPRMSELDLHLPVPAEQAKIVQFLTSLDSILETLNKQITQTQEWKKGLLQGMFV
ncbi:restriction endonuclease subunit S [Algoriphagus sp. H41]|uniref:Restriction endonuclease subunit S n=1 Tax=Algoriphagus oliviformis TaxID=2811231 RepID=A0ABS3C3V7_9BACT|nr:restriction endonuclease subunit S [Algoriphagus oliviformis]MBN7810850.1 restriction endonuclease subunit S [Algoriphagus oliviformis]